MEKMAGRDPMPHGKMPSSKPKWKWHDGSPPPDPRAESRLVLLTVGLPDLAAGRLILRTAKNETKATDGLP
jgi:hypothetical protein